MSHQPEQPEQPEHTMPQIGEHEHRVRQPQPGEQRGAVTDALIQTAQDLKEVGLGALGAAAYDQITKPKDPPKDK
jgi:hypothetical protein